MKRSSGVLMHISSLWGEYGCGCFDDNAKKFVDFLSNCKFNYWQVLPFCMVDDCNSPYKSYSAFGGNPYFISLDELVKKGYLTRAEVAAQKQAEPYSCEFDKLRETRIELLKLAASRVTDRREVEEYIEKSPYIGQFARFMAIKDANKESPWTEWAVEKYDENVLFAWKFIQYEFFRQWSEIKKYANQKGIKIIGDMPIYVAYDSADVWANKEMFLLDEDNKVIPLLEAQLKEVRKSIDNVMKAIEAGIITRSTKAKLEELEAEEEQIEFNILKEQTSTPKLTKEQILFALDKFRKLDLTIEANKERLIDSLVKCIILYDDKLVITFNFKNEPVTVPTSDELEAIEGSSDIEAFASPTKN